VPVHNADIATVFEEIADLLEIQGANPFRVRAYRNASREMSELGRDVSQMVAGGEDLTTLPGIGDDLAAKIAEIVHTGHCGLLDRLRKQLPPAVGELLHVPGLGPKKVRMLWHDLGVETAQQLYQAAREGRIRQIHGFGEKSEQKILEAVEAHIGKDHRFRLDIATQYADGMVAYLRKVAGVKQVEVAGSFRRRRETVGDLDILVSAPDGDAVASAFVAYEEVKEVLARGPNRASVVLQSGIQVDLKVTSADNYGAALCYFTGSKAHSISLRRIARARGLKLNEYGVFRGNRRIAGNTEESIYKTLDLDWIAPELREDRGEIEAARAHRLPQLVRREELKGDLHAHTRATDGHDSLRDMALAAHAAGLEYLAITDHSRRLTMAHGLDPRRLAAQIDEIDTLNKSLKGIRLLKSIEVGILEDGRLDLPDSILSRLDLVVGAVHSYFDLPRKAQTDRIMRAMDNPWFTILSHPSGRLIDSREPYDVDMPRIIRHAHDRGCFLELDAQPERLDLLDTWCMIAREGGVLVSIDSDAPNIHDFAHLEFGVGQARRGWLEAKDVLNARPLDEIMKLVEQCRSRAPKGSRGG
jgi:DNA polymerase (family 10)